MTTPDQCSRTNCTHTSAPYDRIPLCWCHVVPEPLPEYWQKCYPTLSPSHSWLFYGDHAECDWCGASTSFGEWARAGAPCPMRPEPEPEMDGCPIVWTSPSGEHWCMHPINGHPARHEPYVGSPSFMAVGYEDMSQWPVRRVPRVYTGAPMETPQRPVAASGSPEAPRTPIQEFAAASDALTAAGKAVGEVVGVAILDAMLKVARWLERKTRGKR